MGSCLSSLVSFKTAAVASTTEAFLASRVVAAATLWACVRRTNAPGRMAARIRMTVRVAAV
jgi:hypothetical protein